MIAPLRHALPTAATSTTLALFVLVTSLASFFPLATSAQDSPIEESADRGGRIVQAEDTTPIEGAIVTLYTLTQQGLGDQLSATKTDANGRFELDKIDDGRYGLRSEIDGRAIDLRALAITDGRIEPRPLTIELALAFTIHGTIVEEGTQEPIQGVPISVGNISTQTDDFGNFSLERLPQGLGTYDLAIRHRGYVPTTKTLEEVTVPIHDGVLVALHRGESARFIVIGPDGNGVKGANITLRFFREDPYSPFRSFFNGETDDQGECTISGLSYQSPYVVEIRLDGYPTHQSTPRWLDRSNKRHRLEISASSRVMGRVIDSLGAPVAGAKVKVIRLVQPLLSFGGPDPNQEDTGTYLATTNPTGRFRLEGLPSGAQRIRVDAEGYEIFEALVRPTVGESGEELTLKLLTTVSCRRKRNTTVAGIAWEPAVDVAFLIAQREKRPVFLAMAMDDEPANDGIARMHFKNPELIELTRYTCPLLSTAFDHTPEDEPRGLDQRYGHRPSSVFQAVEVWARNLIGGGQVVNVPRHLFFDPVRRILSQRTLWLSERDLRRMIVESLRHVSPEDATLLANRMHHDTLRRCRSIDPDERCAALEELVILASVGDELASAAIADLDAETFPVDGIVLALRRIGSGQNRLIDVLNPFLRHRDPVVAREAAKALARGGAESDLEEALPFLKDLIEPTVRIALLNAYGITQEQGRLDFSKARGTRLGHRVAIILAKKKQSDAIREVLDRLDSDNSEARVDCAYAAAAIGTSECLAALSREVDKGGYRGVVMAQALGTTKNPQAASFLLPGLKDHSWLLREAAARALGDLHVSSTAPFLRPLLTDPHTPVRIAAAEALWNLGINDGLPTLVDALERSFYRDRAERTLNAAYLQASPTTAEDWDEWLRKRYRESVGGD